MIGIQRHSIKQVWTDTIPGIETLGAFNYLPATGFFSSQSEDWISTR